MKYVVPKCAVALLVFGSLLSQVQAEQETYTFITKNGGGVFLTRTNKHGVSVGGYSDQTGTFVRLFQNGNETLIPVPGDVGTTPSIGDINDTGDIVGEYFRLTIPYSVGFIMKGGVITPLQVPGEGRTTPQGLNNRGVVVGTFQVVGSDTTQAFYFEKGVYTKIPYPGAQYVNLWDVNDAGDAVGEITTSGDPVQEFSFLYQNGTITPLPVHPNFARTRFFSINNKNEMTGQLSNLFPNEEQVGFIFRDGQFETFKILGSLVFVPFGITDNGDVTGYYYAPGNFDGTTFIRQGQ